MQTGQQRPRGQEGPRGLDRNAFSFWVGGRANDSSPFEAITRKTDVNEQTSPSRRFLWMAETLGLEPLCGAANTLKNQLGPRAIARCDTRTRTTRLLLTRPRLIGGRAGGRVLPPPAPGSVKLSRPLGQAPSGRRMRPMARTQMISAWTAAAARLISGAAVSGLRNARPASPPREPTAPPTT